MSTLTLKCLCQQKILESLADRSFYPKDVHELCSVLPPEVADALFQKLFEQKAFTDEILLAFLVPERHFLRLGGLVNIRNSTFKQIAFNCPNLV
jgi:hypothetical protein